MLRTIGLALCALTAQAAVPPVFFDVPKAYLGNSGPFSSIAVADFNGDGKPDIAAYAPVCEFCQGKIEVFLNDGRGGLRAPSTYNGGSSYYPVGGQQALATGDFNNDGKPDLVVVNSGSTTVSVLLNKGDGTFYPRMSFQAGAIPDSVAVGDFNNDGNLDLVIAGTVGVVGGYAILLGNGDGTFQPAKTSTTGYGGGIAVGDFNGDGNLDLALVNSVVAIALGNGDGTFKTPVAYAAGPKPSYVVAGDFQNKGKLDLAVANDTSIAILLGRGDGTFGPPLLHTVSSANVLAVGDFDGDGNLDIAAAGLTSVSILLGRGNGGFGPATSYNAPGSPASIQVADFNGDGQLDVAAGNGSDYVSIMPGGGHGALQQSPVGYFASLPGSIISADFNLDGNLDIAFNSLEGGEIQIMLGNGDGTFQPAITVPGSEANGGIATGDLNGDGKPDLVLTNLTDYGFPGTVTVLLGNGDGTFGPPMSFPGGIEPVNPVLGDFNGDGNLDVVLVNATEGYSPGTISVLLGNGDGTLEAPIVTAAGNQPGSLIAGDFNRDGKLDLAVVDYGADNNLLVTVFLGNGNGTFQTLPSFPAPTPPSYLATFMIAGDFNGDGVLDLAMSNGTGMIFVALGIGDGTFQAPLGSPGGATYLVAADYNGDGKLDVAGVFLYSGTEVLLGNGDGTFSAPVNYAGGGASVAGLFNKNAFPDLVGTSIDSIVVMPNTTKQYQGGNH